MSGAQSMSGTPFAAPRHPALRVVEIAGKGRGVIAAEPIRADEVLEATPVIPLRADELGPDRQGLFSYTFHWDFPPYVEAIPLGLICLLNHSPTPNAWFDPDVENGAIRVVADRDIAAGEEITIDYGIPLWFEYRP